MKTNQKIEVIMQISKICNKRKLAEEIGISRPTLNSRLSGKSEWTKTEEKYIETLFKKAVEQHELGNF